MKKGFNITLILSIVVALIVAGSVGLYYYLPTTTLAASLPDWLVQKNEILSFHDQLVKENMAKPIVRIAANSAYLNTKAPEFQTAVVSVDYGNPIFPEEIAAKYSFTNQAVTRYSHLLAGAKVSDPTFGIILGRKWDPATSQDTKVEYDFPGYGSITFTSVQGDIAYFKTAKGSSGELNVATGVYSLK